jgi:hypothetical protein
LELEASFALKPVAEAKEYKNLESFFFKTSYLGFGFTKKPGSGSGFTEILIIFDRTCLISVVDHKFTDQAGKK